LTLDPSVLEAQLVEVQSRWRRVAHAASVVLVVASAVALVIAGALILLVSLPIAVLGLQNFRPFQPSLTMALLRPFLPSLGMGLLGGLLLVLGNKLLAWGTRGRS
jgi:hypothetical protein